MTGRRTDFNLDRRLIVNSPLHDCRWIVLLIACEWFAPLACAQPSEPDWRHEKVLQVVPAASLPTYADKHCLAVPGASVDSEEAILLRFRVGHANYYQAFPVTAEHAWHAGERVAFVPRTCEVKATGADASP